MTDRIFLPALTFVLLVAAASAFAIDLMHSRAAQPQGVVQLERVVIVAQRETPVALAVAAAAEERR